jgi:hypothetical protein
MSSWKHAVLVWADDAAYVGAVLYLGDATWVDRFFIPEIGLGPWTEPMRYGIYLATILQLRDWLEGMGISTRLFSHYLAPVVNAIL